ncbi:MAG: hypothetical protein IKD53_08315 [Clostridia bacterium]|nr:hypothetical protein [Clostridia bacterium]
MEVESIVDVHDTEEACSMSESQVENMRKELLSLGMSEEKVEAIMAEVTTASRHPA